MAVTSARHISGRSAAFGGGPPPIGGGGRSAVRVGALLAALAAGDAAGQPGGLFQAGGPRCRVSRPLPTPSRCAGALHRRSDRAGVTPIKAVHFTELRTRIDAFLADESPDAFETVVDRLLASPHYGERWGRHWLEVARFGEDDTRGLAQDGSGRERYPSAYVQRDWVVDAFNRDMPWDLYY